CNNHGADQEAFMPRKPRIAPLEIESWSDDARTILSRWNPPFNIHKVLAHAPKMMQAWIVFGNHILFNSLLPERERELVILRIAWNTQCAYEWGQHAGLSKRLKIPDADIYRVPKGPRAKGWSPHESALLKATDDLMARFEISDPAWATLSQTYSDEQMIDLVFLVGEFVLVAMALKSFRVPLDAGLEALPSGLKASGRGRRHVSAR
ncbi:MAG: carboxymuconolactone decarboxylase family protein, partial [Caulobacterales bacterium]